MKNNFYFLILLFIGISFFPSCFDDKPVNNQEPDYPVQVKNPSIQNVSPAVALPGSKVTIIGENFGNDPSDVEITFGSIVAEITFFSRSKIEVIVPPRGNLESVNIQVKVGDRTSNAHTFEYDYPAPVIESLSPQVGKTGSRIDIIGSHLSNVRENITVTFDEKTLTVESISDNSITITIPEYSGKKTVGVRVKVKEKVSNTVSFNYEVPLITLMSATCFQGSIVIITGEDFSPNIDENIVKFGNITAVVVEATEAFLKVITPNLGSATTADVTVTRHGMTSDSKRINVNLDQDKIARHNWTTHTLKLGVIYKTGELALFGSSMRRINVLDVTLDESNVLGIGFSTSNKSTVAMCNDYGAVAGINAGYFPMSGAVDKDPYIRINGVEVQQGNVGTVSQRFVNSALTIHNNIAKVRHIQGSANLNLIAAKITFSEAENVIVSGPILFIDHNHITPDNNPHNTSSTARTGLGVVAEGKRVIMVTVDTGNGSTGVTIPQLGLILQALGAVDAMSFDGGGSTTMFAQGLGSNGLVNLPSGGVQRAVRSVVYVK